MSQQIEIELKNILTKAEFIQLKQYLHFTDKDFFKQINYYFDTPHFTLKNNNQALRIREKNGHYELTLKQQAEVGLLETNEQISPSQFEQMIHTGEIPNGNIRTIVHTQLQDNETIAFFGHLTTWRAEKEYMGGLIVLDNSSYLNVEDFELEYEVSNLEIGQKHFDALLTNQAIPKRNTINKIARFYLRKKQLMMQKK